MKPEIETASGTWKLLEAHAAERIAALRERNDVTSVDVVGTAHLRGQIAAWKALLALGKAPAQPADDGGPGY